MVLWWQFPDAYSDAVQWTLETSDNLVNWQPQAAVIKQPQPGWLSISLPGVILDNPKGCFRLLMALKP